MQSQLQQTQTQSIRHVPITADMVKSWLKLYYSKSKDEESPRFLQTPFLIFQHVMAANHKLIFEDNQAAYMYWVSLTLQDKQVYIDAQKTSAETFREFKLSLASEVKVS